MEDLEDEIGYIPPIKEYYQPNPCVKRDTESWEAGPVRQSSKMNIVVKKFLESENKVMLSEIDIENVVKIFLKSENKVLLLAADFGTGKTTASRILASKYAEDFEKVGSNYIPIFLKLTENSREDIESKLDKITMTKYQKTLLILDGLDEITSEERDEIISLVAECRKNYPNIKIIITTRFGIYLDKSKGKFFRKLGLEHFYQLLPLTEELAENMLEKLGGLSLDEIRKLGISEEEYTKPIYLYLLWVLKKTGKLEKLRGYGKSGIYLALTNLVSRCKAKCVKDKEIKLEEKKDKKARNVLMHIAVLRTIFESEELSKEEIEEFLSDDIRKDLDKIGTDFLITTYLKDPSNLTFIHKSFQEYLTAEYLFVSFLSGHFEGFYLFPVTQEIFDFLKGLVKMFHEYWKNSKLDEFRELLEIADINPDKEEIKEKMDKQVKQAKEVLEGKVFYIIFDIKFKNSESENKIELDCDKKKDPEKAVIKYLTGEDDKREEYSIVEIYRKNVAGFKFKFYRIGIYDIKSIAENFVSGSIALMEVCHIITGYEFISETIKDTVSQLLRANRKLHSIDLCKAKLIGAKLIGTDLSWAVLIGTDLSGAKLIKADLSYADLRKAKLIGTDLSGADLSDINWGVEHLSKTFPVVKGANFENAKINDREFVEYLRKNGAKNVPIR